MIISWPLDVISDVARRRCVIVLGSGISSNCINAAGLRPKSWASFLSAAIALLPGTKARRDAISKLVRERDYLTACQVIRDTMGTTAFHQLAIAEYLTPGFPAADIHDRIIDLDSRIVATPNFDTIYENRVNHLWHNSVAVKHYYDNDLAESLRGTPRIVLKIHGTIALPNQMIFTRDDYSKARNKYPQFYEILAALALTHTFLFLGCGLDDPDIRLLLEDYAFKHDFSKPHYFVLPQRRIAASVLPALEKSLNIKVLTYPAPGGDHTALVTAIEELRDQVLIERESIALSRDW